MKVTKENIEENIARAATCADVTIPGEAWREYLRLARLGLWASEHYVAIKDGLEAGDRFYYGASKFTQALSALPKEPA